MPELSALDSLRWGESHRERVSFYSPSLVLNTSRYPGSHCHPQHGAKHLQLGADRATLPAWEHSHTHNLPASDYIFAGNDLRNPSSAVTAACYPVGITRRAAADLLVSSLLTTDWRRGNGHKRYLVISPATRPAACHQDFFTETTNQTLRFLWLDRKPCKLRISNKR